MVSNDFYHRLLSLRPWIEPCMIHESFRFSRHSFERLSQIYIGEGRILVKNHFHQCYLTDVHCIIKCEYVMPNKLRLGFVILVVHAVVFLFVFFCKKYMVSGTK